MIANYLEQLYSNCKALAKKDSYSIPDLRDFFSNHINELVISQDLNTEIDLTNFLISKSYKDLKEIFNQSKFIHVFYLINSLNEYNHGNDELDNLGRYKFESSVIKELGIKNNTVLSLIKETVEENVILNSMFKVTNHKSLFYLSHDIDSIYGSFTQDGLWALKNKRIDVLLKIYVNAIISKPDWLNFDLIMKTESEYDFKSTFYWLVNKGKIDNRQTNSDYSITSPKIIEELRNVSSTGFENGLHKSISEESFKTEINKMPVNIIGNRYHYLKFNLPNGYDKLEESGLELDASLGFAEHYGFRNGYGYPFHPFNISKSDKYSFLEVPLTIMDGTFQRYMNIPVEKTADEIINFLETNNQNALLSILWHNTFFSNYKYKGYLAEYKKILGYLRDSKFRNINQSEIIKEFSWQNQ